MIGNISVVGVDEDELRRLMMEREQKSSEETQRFKMKELELHQELDEMKTKYERLEVQKKSSKEQVEGLNQLLKTKEDEGGRICNAESGVGGTVATHREDEREGGSLGTGKCGSRG